MLPQWNTLQYVTMQNYETERLVLLWCEYYYTSHLLVSASAMLACCTHKHMSVHTHAYTVHTHILVYHLKEWFLYISFPLLATDEVGVGQALHMHVTTPLMYLDQHWSEFSVFPLALYIPESIVPSMEPCTLQKLYTQQLSVCNSAPSKHIFPAQSQCIMPYRYGVVCVQLQDTAVYRVCLCSILHIHRTMMLMQLTTSTVYLSIYTQLLIFLFSGRLQLFHAHVHIGVEYY